MESITNIRDILVPFLGILIIIFFLIGVIVTLRYMTNVLDAKGAILGLKKSILYYLLAIVSAAIMLLLSDQEYLYTSLCFLSGGLAFILLFFGIQYFQMSLVLNRSEKQKKSEKNNEEGHGKRYTD